MGLITKTDWLHSDSASIFTLADMIPDPWQSDLLRSPSRRMLLLCSRQSGKSTTAAALALKSALLEVPSLILLLSPTLRQSGELFRDKVCRLYNRIGRTVKAVRESALSMELANGSRIISLPGDEETVRGYSGVSLLVIDEAARVPDELYYAVRPMLAVSGGRMICMSTPFGKRGWFFREWQSNGPWKRVRVTADQCPRISPEFLAEEKSQLGGHWYAQEYCCEFADDSGVPLFPFEWLDRAERIMGGLSGTCRAARAIGIDPAEGGDKTAMCAVDGLGIIELISKKTPDTSVITGEAIAFMLRHKVPPDRVVFDRGGGGKEHADRLRSQGYPVRTVAFGESLVPDPRRGLTQISERKENREERYAYVNRRAEMYGELRLVLDPHGGIDGVGGSKGFGIPAEYAELRRQMSPIPLTYDPEGRLKLLPKNKRSPDGTEKSLTELIGHSPDELDSLVLALHGMLREGNQSSVAYAAW